ncbi:MAG: carotenoid biosynthesis protein [Chloroflexi bacterium]|nr:carotenoid biosynthesis protein [Chloroflexota bacterium]
MRQTQFPHRWRTVVTILFFAYAALNSYFVLTPVLGAAPPAAMVMVPVLMGSFSLCHALYVLGIRHALGFFAVSTTVSLVFEAVGVATGLVYGPYHYSDLLGPRLFAVPIVVPLAWFMVIYPSYTLANYLVSGTIVSQRGTQLSRTLGLAGLSAMLMTAWDLLLDPQMTADGYWTWHVEGSYFGIPVHNFVGWLLTTLTIFTIYRVAESRWPSAPWGPLPHRFMLQPLAIYGLLAGGYTVGFALQQRPEVALIALFAMGTPTLAALVRRPSNASHG